MKKLLLSIILSIITITTINAKPLYIDDLETKPFEYTFARCTRSSNDGSRMYKVYFMYGPQVERAYEEQIEAGCCNTISLNSFNEVNVEVFGEEYADFLNDSIVEAVRHYKLIYILMGNTSLFISRTTSNSYIILVSSKDENGSKGN